MNIYLFEMKMLRKSIFLWGLFVPFGLIFYMSFFPMMAGDSANFNAILESYPPEMLAFFGFNTDLPVTSVLGYFALTLGMIQIPLAIQASNYGFHILSVEERELTADFLLSKPISRSKIYFSKFLAVSTSLLIVNIIVSGISILSIFLFKGSEVIDFTNVFILLSTIGLFQLVFLSIGLVISVSIKKVSSVLSFSMALGFGLYILSSLGTMLSSKMLSIISPYFHFAPAEILVTGSLDWGLASISISIIIISLVASYFLYQKRNIASL